jgi:P4 family phage/plasmid primase-like protien
MSIKNLNLKKISFKGTTTNQIKAEKKAFAKLYNSNILKDDDNYNAYVLKLNKEIFIVDCDDKTALEYVNSLIEEHNIEPVYTKSISNKMKIEKNKYHYYFQNNLKIKSNKTGVNGGKLDLLVNSLLFEDAEEFDNIDVDDLPELTDEIYKKLLLFNAPEVGPNDISTEEEPVLETPTGTPTNKLNDVLQCININRFKNYSDWWVIGAILKEIDEHNFDIFNDYSKNCGYAKYNYNDVLTFWNNHNINKGGCKKTIFSLYKLAKQDNPDKYKDFLNLHHKTKTNKKIEFIENLLNSMYDDIYIPLSDLEHIDSNIDSNIVNKSISYFLLTEIGKPKPKLETVDFTKIFNVLYKNQFINNINILYYYNGVYWERQINDSKINQYIIYKLYPTLNTIIGNLHSNLLKCKIDDNNRDYYERMQDYIYELAQNLRKIMDGTVKKKVVEEIKLHIVNNDVQFDEHPYLFCFNNKLFDLKQLKFIEPKSDYYISQTTGYNYDDKFENNKIEEVEKLLESIIPNQIIREYWLTLVATCLTGINIQKFIVASGTGGNGKSLFHEFLLSMLGNYGTTLKNNILTTNIKDGATPEVAGLHNIRGCVTSEPDADKRIVAATLKPITGNESMKARHLYGNEFQALMKLTFIMECNDIPKLDEVNEAIERRLIRIIFPKSFISEDDYNKLDESEKVNYGVKNSYYSTNDFRKDYRQALFSILCRYVSKYNDSLQMPDEVKQNTKIYLNSSDDLHEWINATYDFTDNIKDTIKIKDIYNTFKSSDYFNNLNKKQKREFNYKWFVNKLETNLTLKKYVGMDNHDINILRKYNIKQSEQEESPLEFTNDSSNVEKIRCKYCNYKNTFLITDINTGDIKCSNCGNENFKNK